MMQMKYLGLIQNSNQFVPNANFSMAIHGMPIVGNKTIPSVPK
jgi:hypothetical protein